MSVSANDGTLYYELKRVADHIQSEFDRHHSEALHNPDVMGDQIDAYAWDRINIGAYVQALHGMALCAHANVVKYAPKPEETP